jgi:hypothetical protein
MGDPATPILAAYEGDPLFVRLIQGAQEVQHVFAMTGNKWLKEPDNPRSGHVSAQPLGISEHFEFDIKVNPQATPRMDSLYLGSSIDQLWDGMWGLVRSYGSMLSEQAPGPVPAPTQPGLARLNSLPGTPVALPAQPLMSDRDVQVCAPENHNQAYLDRLFFDVSAVRACDLTDTCGRPGQRGIAYNQRLNLDDPNAIVFVRNNRLPGHAEPRNFSVNERNDQILSRLRDEVRTGQRRIEPLVLRAPAGACMAVMLRNHLPVKLPDGPVVNGLASTAHFSDNFMSMIMDGFNYNQLTMSSSVGLSAPMVARYGLLGDGANIGINALELKIASDEAAAASTPVARGRLPTPLGDAAPGPVLTPRRAEVHPQGNLAPACRDGEADQACTVGPMIWYAGDYQLKADGTQKNAPMELGVLPLSSFGDVIKHPAHGAIGALVIGPSGTQVCVATNADERAADVATDTSATICKNGHALYRDFVMVLQDAVDAKINGDRVANLKGAEEPDDYGIKAVNYRTEPLWGRRGGDPSIEFEERNEFHYGDVHSSKSHRNDAAHTPVPAGEADTLLATHGFAKASGILRCQAGIDLLSQSARHACDPETPLFVARAGSEVRLRVVHPGGHTRQQAFTVHGHDWDRAPWNLGSNSLKASHAQAVGDAWTVQGSYNGVGPLMGANLLVHAGGRAEVPMDYLWRSQASFVYDGGIWGLMRVTPAD